MRIGSAKQSYAADSALFDSTPQRVWIGVLAVALCTFPFVASEYWLYLACLVAINIASATGLNILTGYTGLVSLGQAAFMGLGAYTVAILQIRFGLPFVFNLLAGGLVAMLAGILVGLPSLRVKGLYLAIATIAAGVMAHFIFSHFTALTGGSSGLTVPPARFFGIELDDSFKLYWVIVPVAVLMLLGAANLFRTRIGRAFIAIRDRDISAEVLGISLLHYKLLAFAISSFYAGRGCLLGPALDVQPVGARHALHVRHESDQPLAQRDHAGVHPADRVHRQYRAGDRARADHLSPRRRGWAGVPARHGWDGADAGGAARVLLARHAARAGAAEVSRPPGSRTGPDTGALTRAGASGPNRPVSSSTPRRRAPVTVRSTAGASRSAPPPSCRL